MGRLIGSFKDYIKIFCALRFSIPFLFVLIILTSVLFIGELCDFRLIYLPIFSISIPFTLILIINKKNTKFLMSLPVKNISISEFCYLNIFIIITSAYIISIALLLYIGVHIEWLYFIPVYSASLMSSNIFGMATIFRFENNFENKSDLKYTVFITLFFVAFICLSGLFGGLGGLILALSEDNKTDILYIMTSVFTVINIFSYILFPRLNLKLLVNGKKLKNQ